MKIFLQFKLTVLLLLLSISAAFAQTGDIKGTVTTRDGKPAVAVTLSLAGEGRGAITNDQGNYQIPRVRPGAYLLKVSAVGLSAKEQQIQVAAGGTVTADFMLEENESTLQEVVVSSPARKFAEKKSDYVARMPLANLENPQVYTVVPKELFQEQIVTDLRSALQTVPGLTSITQGVGSGGIGLSIRLRGFSGTNAGGAIRNGMATNWVSLSDPVNLEAIEVIKGPSATLFGGVLVSYGGLVNRVTKKPHDVAGGSIDYSTGNFGLSRLSADINTPLNAGKTLLFRVNAAYDNQKSFQDYGRSSTQVLAPALTYHINDRLTLNLDFEYYNTRRNTTYIGSIPTNGSISARSFNDLNIDFKNSFSNNDFLSAARIFNAYAQANYKLSAHWTSQTNYSYANTDNQANYMFLALTSDQTFSRRVMNIPATFGVSQVQQNVIGDVKIAGLRNRLLVGLDYTQITSNDRRTGQLAYDVVQLTGPTADLSLEKYQQSLATATRTTYNRNYQTTSAYASDVINFTDRFIGMASVRLDHYRSIFDNYAQTKWSPKFGLVYQVVKEKVSLFGNYMNGFSNIPPQNVFGSSEKVAFKPEQANQLEGGLKAELLGGKLNGTLSYYHIKVKDKIRVDPINTSGNFSVQDGTQVSEGFEADLIANPFRGMHLILGYAYNDSRYTRADSSVTGLRPTSAPAHTANAWLSYKIMQGKLTGLGLGFGGNFQSDAYYVNVRTKTVAGNKYWTQNPYQFKVNEFVRLDATVFYDQPQYRLGIKVNNLTNKQYWTTDAWAYREPTRQFIVNVSYKF